MKREIKNILTSEMRLNINLKIFSPKDQEFVFMGYDSHPSHSNTVYFDYECALKKGENSHKIPMPISPDSLNLVISANSDFMLESISTSKLPLEKLDIAPENIEYLDFSEKFSKMAGYCNSGTYKNKDGSIVFYYMDSIDDAPQTPARVDHNSPVGETYLSKQYLPKYSTTIRHFIQTHERAHWFTGIGYNNEPGAETEVDLIAADILLAQGYPKRELLHAATRVLPSTQNMSQQRALALSEFIEKH
tara:strand:+ start:19669 stop:20409 length:741 start_codon:yes stop_codon:yes gene_type:complete